MTTILEQGNISIHTENIFPIIKKALYSEHEIFLRELVSNAVDAIKKLSMAARSGEYNGDVSSPEIEIKLDKDKKTLSVSDTGIGMTADEVKKYINQVAFSSAEEFHRPSIKTAPQKTRSSATLVWAFTPPLWWPPRWRSTPSLTRKGPMPSTGAVTAPRNLSSAPRSAAPWAPPLPCTLMEGEEEYTEPARIQQLIKTYCDFMPVPIKLDGEVVNKHEAPWKQSPSSLSDEDYLEFYRYLYPFQEDPLLWIHLNTDYPFVVNGILYFPKLKPDIDVTKSSIKLYCNQVFVTDNCEEVVPRFLLPLRGVIDSTDIPLNVSRSFLQGDRTVRRIADYIAKKVGDSLKALYRDDPAKYISSWQDLGNFVKFGSLNDDKFKKQVEDIMIFRTTAKLGRGWGRRSRQGRGTNRRGRRLVRSGCSQKPATDAKGYFYTTLKEYLERNKEKHENRVFYATDEVSQATYIELFNSQGLEVLYMDSFIDTHFIPSLERDYSDVKFSAGGCRPGRHPAR
jgi:molecular chaperone HtpG